MIRPNFKLIKKRRDDLELIVEAKQIIDTLTNWIEHLEKPTDLCGCHTPRVEIVNFCKLCKKPWKFV